MTKCKSPRLKKQTGFIMAGVLSLCLFFCPPAMSQIQQEQKPAKIESKRLCGTISFLDLKNSPNRIGIDYKEDKASGIAYEMVFFIGEKVKLVHRRNLSNLGLGDNVDIGYDEITSGEQGKKETKRVVTSISFLKSADTATRHKYGVYTKEEKEKRERQREMEKLSGN